MTTTKTFSRALLALAATAAVALPAVAVAQGYYAQDGRYVDRQYDEDRARYDAQQRDYQRARADYDARYGAGAYDRYYAAQSDPSYREERRECHNEKSGNAVAGGLLGGIAGAVIGSNVARGGGRTGGAIIGGVGGAALGSSIAKNSTNC